MHVNNVSNLENKNRKTIYLGVCIIYCSNYSIIIYANKQDIIAKKCFSGFLYLIFTRGVMKRVKLSKIFVTKSLDR